MLTQRNASGFADQFLSKVGSYPDSFDGRGIVTCGGGIKYGACTWVLVKLLRYLGCQSPIEVWCRNDDEFDPAWIDLMEPLGVRCVNAQDVLQRYPHRRLGGWELKPYAIQHSRFREVLFLDADNVPVVDPTFLFDTPEYKTTGTLFWPDPEQLHTGPESLRWKIFGVTYRASPDQESGQLLVDKKRCWHALSLCNWYNEHSDFYYRHVYGDKETFRFAWQRVEQPICWMPYPTDAMPFTLLHYGAARQPLFQHRFYRKWSLYGENINVPGFEHEGLCLEFLAQLRAAWHPLDHLVRRATDTDRGLMGKMVGCKFLYDRPGHNRWPIRLGGKGLIEEGYGPNEFFWWCEGGALILAGIDGCRKYRLRRDGNDNWQGKCQNAGPMRVNLRPLENAKYEAEEDANVGTDSHAEVQLL